jgi:hypothetical protein
MSAPPQQWPILEAVRCWYHNRRVARESAFELQCAGAAEVERIAQDLGLSGIDLCTLVSHPDDRTLLAKRLAGLHLEPAALARAESVIFRDLQRVCAMCGFKYRCARDLAVEAFDPTWDGWRDYCPNAATLSAIGALHLAPRRGDPANWE